MAEFREGKARILLGTQMIAKGLDFPNVTLVGVIQADTALHLPDFRAAERTFHLVTQVAGRTGRGDKGGRVLVQTFSPDHPAIRAAVRHDYAAFAAQELPLREMLHYPPFAAMIRLVIRGESEALAKEFAQRLGQSVSAALEARQAQARVLGPAPRPRRGSAESTVFRFRFKAPTATSCGPPFARPKARCKRQRTSSGSSMSTRSICCKSRESGICDSRILIRAIEMQAVVFQTPSSQPNFPSALPPIGVK